MNLGETELRVNVDSGEPVRFPRDARICAITAEFNLEGDQIDVTMFVANRREWSGRVMERRGEDFAIFPPKLFRDIYIGAGQVVEVKAVGGDCRLCLDGFKLPDQEGLTNGNS